jgi:N-acetyl-gamma-glutamyl-phosphate reductase
VFAVTGSSGAGIQPRATTHHPARAHNLFAYSVMGHRHEGEIVEQWRQWTGNPAGSARLMAHSGPFVRGIYATLHATVAEPAPAGTVAQRYRDAFAGRPFVRVLEQPPELTHAVGSNLALLHPAVSEDGREIQVTVAVDNLIKGAGGQAVQAMNLALGLDETAGLKLAGMFPC